MNAISTALSIAQFSWANTTDQWQRLLVRCLGIAFAVVLMFIQTGFRNALFDSNVRIMEQKIEADIVIRSPARFMFSSRQQIPLEHVIAACSVAGVDSALPLYLENASSEFRSEGYPSRRIRVLAFEIGHPTFANFGLSELRQELQPQHTAVADHKSKPQFGFPEQAEDLRAKPFELAGKRVKLVGFFENGIDFSNDGNLIMTPENFARYFRLRGDGDPLSMVDYGVIRCASSANIPRVIARLQELLGPHVMVESKSDFVRSDRKFWSKNTPIGLVFWFGTILGFIIGMGICYQVLATDIRDHLGEFSTLKAMGYGPLFFGAVVVFQGVLLALTSFVPGTVIAWLAFEVTNWGTGLDLFLNVPRVLFMLAMTVSMCVLSGLFALRKLLLTDPASLFG
jgi:putative ABC transport system permease protein